MKTLLLWSTKDYTDSLRQLNEILGKEAVPTCTATPDFFQVCKRIGLRYVTNVTTLNEISNKVRNRYLKLCCD